MIAMVWASCGWSAPTTYTPAQVEAVFLRSGVPLVIGSRDSFPADTNLSVLLILRSGRSLAGSDTGDELELKVAVYDRASSAEAAYRWVHEYSRQAELAGNVLVAPGVGLTGRDAQEVGWAIYQLVHPYFYR
jgi:hypothetical protein